MKIVCVLERSSAVLQKKEEYILRIIRVSSGRPIYEMFLEADNDEQAKERMSEIGDKLFGTSIIHYTLNLYKIQWISGV